jgi:L-asparaginase
MKTMMAFRAAMMMLSMCWAGQAMAESAKDAKPRIAILATGGTIAGSKADPNTRYRSGTTTVEMLVSAVPSLSNVATIEAEQVSNVGSQDMNEEIWARLAARVAALRARPDVAGIVITHGTDTLEETAMFLDLLFPTGKPIVLTAAMRPSDAVSADGPRNMLEAAIVASSPAAADRGALVVLNDVIHAARRVSKIDTGDINAFASDERGLLGRVDEGKVRFFADPPPARQAVAVPLPIPARLPKVAILYSHAGVDPDLVRVLPSLGYRGIVLAGVGNGNTSKAMLDALAEAARKGMVVVRASRVPAGSVLSDVEVDDKALGFEAALDLNPQKARVALQLRLLGGARR